MLPSSLSREQAREIDRRAIEEFGMPGIVLMENAGRGAAELLMRLGAIGSIVVCAGKGNNGGDGFVIARHLENHRHSIKVLLYCSPDELTGDAAVNFRIIEAARTPVRVVEAVSSDLEFEPELAEADWIVDALLGTGAQGVVRAPFSMAIAQINRSGAHVLAVDLPSGLDCDTGRPLGACVRADHTATFVARKRGFDRPESREWTGTVHVIDIGVPHVLLHER